ncbi:non-ribosomal peptide synthetase [Nonomuraea guangzhouensis]|uniref:Non-ribosomal peptide synthetase n=1 Tax=Nonomuraea guangzhouensis TaxID=1291555 RepID=A0ABW4GYH8_9ACTN|nr:non-ribosomal peptide synthetase [Nonomuraea guangzhouensis]
MSEIDGLDGLDGLDAELLAAYESLSPERRDLLTRELARRRAVRPRIPRRQGGSPLPVSFAQERLWFLDQLEPGSVAYVMPVAVRLRGRLDVDVLARCFTEIVRRHETLRTTFPIVDGKPYQRVDEPALVRLPVTDLRELPAADREATVEARYRSEVGRPFDLTAEHGLRLALLRLADEEHVLLLTMHHIVSDGWSMGVLVRELATLYEALAQGRPSPLPELSVQYGDHAVWQRDRIEEALAAQLGFWRERLDGAPVLQLPTDRPRTAARTSAGAAVPLRLDPEVTRRLELLAKQHDATLFMGLQAAFAVLMLRWSGQEDLVIGYPIAGRSDPDLEHLIGFFANTLPLRLDLSGDPAFADVLAQVSRECTAAYEHQDVPFERLVRELRVDRTTGPVPLVQVMLALRNVPMPEIRLSGLSLELLEQQSQSTKFDLCLDLVPDGQGGIEGRAEYSTGLFDAATIERMMDCFGLLLSGLVDDPAQPISAAPLIPAPDGLDLLERLCGGDSRAEVAAETIHGLFEARADAGPETVAVVCGDDRLTYRKLDERANRLARHLRERGAGPEQVVGVCLPRSADMVVALLGLLKAGAAYVPLDPGYPPKRVAYMVEDAGVRLVITTGPVADSGILADAELDVVCLDREAEQIAARPADRPAQWARGHHLCYVIYTSGSTGRPKGSMNEHAGVVNSVCGMNGVYHLTPDDRMLAISSLNYDMSVYEIFGALAAGATVVVPSDIEITDPVQLRDLLVRQRVTAWSSAPALMDMLVNYAAERDGLPGVRLRTVGLGGDRMPPALPARLQRLVPEVRLLNLAGMTEVSYCSTSYPVPRGDIPLPSIPWGRPLPGHRVYVLDRHLRAVPLGVPGELYIGGLGPGRGYWRRPGLTAQRFLADPHAVRPGGRMYATGDRARFLPNGDLEFLGRLDHQLKVRGFRIEAGEVEAALAAHPAVGEPVVVTREEPGGDRRLVAYVTVTADPAPSQSELRQFLTDRLPGHMVPSQFVVLDRLPRLPSGKLNRGALPDPGGRLNPSTDYEPPEGELEEVLADVLADVLEVDRVGVLDDFFDLGGHSLLATQAVSRIRELFRVDLPIPVFLIAGTVRDLAAELRELGMMGGVDVDAVADLVVGLAEETVTGHDQRG